MCQVLDYALEGFEKDIVQTTNDQSLGIRMKHLQFTCI